MALATPCVLMYHNVVPSGSAPVGFRDRYTVTTDQLHAHLTHILMHGQTPRLASDLHPDQRAVALTFDDGFVGTALFGLPLLRSLHMPATLFVTTSRIGQPGYASEAHLHAWLAAGFELGAHGATHRALADLPDDEAAADLQTAKDTLERLAGRPCLALSFPGGSTSSRVQKLAFGLGYTHLFTSQPTYRHTPPGVFGRFAVHPGDGAEKIDRLLQGRFDASVWRDRLLYGLRSKLSHARYARLRRMLLHGSRA